MTYLAFTITSSILLVQAVLGQTIEVDGTECPKGWASTQFNSNEVYCCYGSLTVNNNNPYCCVQGSGGDKTIMLEAFPSQQCVDEVPFSASDYSQRVSAASKSAAATQTSDSRPSSNSASATKLDSSSGTSATAASSPGLEGSSSSSAAIVTTNAASAVTHGVVQIGGIMAVVVMLVI